MSHPLRAVFLVLLIIVLSQPGAIAQASDVLPSRNEIIAKCILANDNWIANNGGETNPGETSQWDPGAYYTGNQRLIEILSDGIPSEATKKAVYLNRAELWAVKHFWQKDPTKDARHADSHCCGQIYIDLYRLDNQAVRLTGVNGTTGIKQTMDNVVDLGATTDGDWDWIDAFYMASPVLAKLDVTIGETDGRDYSAKLLAMYDNMRVTQNLYDGDEGLWYRDDRYPGKTTGVLGAKVFWGRGNGWVIAGLVRVMNELGPTHPDWSTYATMLQAMAAELATLQPGHPSFPAVPSGHTAIPEDGCWRSSLQDPYHYRNPETSGSGFFTYAIAWGINNGILDQATYAPVVARAWNGMVQECLHSNGFLGYVQQTGFEPGLASYTHTEDFGVGAFLLAGAEVSLLAEASALIANAGPDQEIVDSDMNGSEPVTLDGSGTSDPDNKAVAYQWLYNGTVIANGPITSAVFSIGAYAITLRVTDENSNAWEDETLVTVSAPDCYSNSFPNYDVTRTTPYSNNGWSGYITADDGAVTDETNAAVPTAGGTEKDPYLFAAPRIAPIASTGAGLESLLFTTGVPTVSLASLESVSVSHNFDGSVADPASGRFAIRIGSAWYASTNSWSSTTNTGPNGALTTESLLSTGGDFTDGNNWQDLAVTVGGAGTGEISLGSAVGGALSGDVTAFGVYVEHGNGGDHARIDDFVVCGSVAGDFRITNMAFNGSGDLLLTFSPGGVGFILASSDDLSIFTEETSANYDNVDTFTVPAVNLNLVREFFRVEKP